MSRPARRRGALRAIRGSLAALAALSIALQSTAGAYPSDAFSSAGPVQAPAARPSDPAEAQSGHRISDSGALEYSIPLPVAPSRQGMVPELALQYSSRGAVRGGIAMGWTLDVPVIERDTSRGVLAHRDFRSSLSRGALVRVGPAVSGSPGVQSFEEYRAREDAEGTRYVRVLTDTGTIGWRAYTPDGRVYYFGEAADSKDQPNAATAGVPVSEGRFFVTRIVDRFSNTIQFTYRGVLGTLKDKGLAPVRVDIELASVEYGANTAAGLAHHARLDFDARATLDLCPGSYVPIGARYDLRTGYPLYQGARRLETVRLSLRQGSSWVERRRLRLSYDDAELSCNLAGSLHAPLRVLRFVTEGATAPDGTVIAQPPIELQYGRRQRAFTRAVSFPAIDLGSGKQALSTDKGGGWPTVDTMLLDLDGDGAPDPLSSRRGQPGLDPKYCEATWRRNAGGALGTAAAIGAQMPDRSAAARFLPVVPWAGAARADSWTQGEGREDCSLSAQFSRVSAHDHCGYAAAYQSYRFMDVTGDGRPDLVTGLDANRGRYKPERDARLWPSTAGCADPLGCQCTDLGSCTGAQGQPQLCRIIDAHESIGFQSGTPCDGICCPIGGDADVSDNRSAPVAAVGEGQVIDESQSFFHLVQKMFGKNRRPDGSLGEFFTQEQAGEDGGSIRGNPLCQMYPETRCGHYILRIYDNLGDGRFAAQPRLVYAPIPLETDRPTSRLGTGHLAVSSSWHGFIDLDGDGKLDAIYRQPDWGTSSVPVEPRLQVFRGYGLGMFDDNPALWRTDPITGPARVNVSGARTDVWTFPAASSPWVMERTETPSLTASFTSVTLQDLNGDGLPDYIDARESAQNPRGIRVLFNTGTGFEPRTASYGGTYFRGNGAQPLGWLQEDQQWQDRIVGVGTTTRGFSRTTWKLVDLDQDGLLDLVRLPPLAPEDSYTVRPYTTSSAGWQPEVYFNVGDNFVRAANAPITSIWPALANIRVAEDGGELQDAWRVLTDFVDLDGDGLPEAVANSANAGQCRLDVAGSGLWNCYANNNALTDPQDGQALRALQWIYNGKGAATEISYAPIRTAAGRVPHAVWAVTRVAVQPGADGDGNPAPALVTTYAYDGAQYNADPDEQWAFRGFARVEVTAPSGARAVTSRDFTQDYAGLVIDERVYDRPAEPGHAASVTRWTYEQRASFPGSGPFPGPAKVITFHPTSKTVRTCGAAQSESTCQVAGALSRTQHEWQTLTGAGGAPVHVRWRTETSPGAGAVQGAVGQTTGRRLVDGSGRFWLLTESELAWSRGVGGAVVNDGETYTYYDPSDRAVVATSARVEGTTYAVTTRAVDLATGNLTGVKAPRYHAASGPWTTFLYDATRTFVAQTTNPKGHVADAITDAATGVVVEWRGPNTKKFCGGCSVPPRDGWRKAIDGFGRTTAEYAWVDDVTTGYRLEQTARYTYADTPAPRIAVTAERRLEAGGSVWTRVVTEADGLGRKVRTATYEGATLKSLGRSYYDAAGHLAVAREPRPGGTAIAYVDWTYAHDALGRLVAVREPTRTGCAGAIGSTSWCGRRWSYDGLAVTEEDVVGEAGGQIGKTRSTSDIHGRLALVEELQDSGAWAATTYARDGRGNVLDAVSADGVVTSSLYDLAGRRTHVTRGGTTWVFGYDLDGNMTSVQAPVPAGGLLEDHVTTIAYDELGRVTSEVGARRGLSTAERSILGAPTVARTYDQGTNGVGRLSGVVMDGGKTSVAFGHDAQGRVTAETHGLAVWSPAFSLTRQLARTYGLQGQLLSLTAADAATPAAATRFTYQYDGRGLPVSATWYDGGTLRSVVEQVAYNPAGRAYERSAASAGGSTSARGTRQWDDAGRLTSELVESRLPGGGGLTTRAWESLAFDGASDVSTMTTALSATATSASHTAVFGYDRLHRLTSATGPQGYTGAFSYSPGGRVTAAHVDAAPSAARVHRRDVTYAYGPGGGDPDADPDAPVRLDPVGGGAPWMTVDYDPFGNARARSEGAAALLHVYDGFDRQRAASAGDGSLELYWYGADGRRSVVLTTGADGQVQRVRWLVGETELWLGPTGAVTKQLAHANIGGATSRIEDHARRELLYHDARGNLLAVVAEDGALAAGFRYGPYGELLEQLGPEQGEHVRRFNGKEHDALTGLAYYGLRYYDERSLAWTQPDPKYRATVERAAGEPRRASLYAFSLGNPVSMVDPDGGDSGSPNATYEIHVRRFVYGKDFALGFEADNRGPTADLGVTSRTGLKVVVRPATQQLVSVEGYTSGTTARGWFAKAIATPNHAVADIDTSGKARASSLPGAVKLTAHSAGSNPLVPGSSNIDTHLALGVKVSADGKRLIVAGSVVGDPFPGADAVIADSAGNTVLLGGTAVTKGMNTFQSFLGAMFSLPGDGTHTMFEFDASIPIDEHGNFSGPAEVENPERPMSEQEQLRREKCCKQ